jgi:hypothetical protein
MSNIRQYASTAKSINRLQRSMKMSSSMGRPVQYNEERSMKLTFKQKFRNWLMDDGSVPDPDQDIYVEEDKLQSEGMRLQIYKASGGFVVETRSYDRRKDENAHTMHVITEEADLGDALGKIVMMEALRG